MDTTALEGIDYSISHGTTCAVPCARGPCSVQYPLHDSRLWIMARFSLCATIKKRDTLALNFEEFSKKFNEYPIGILHRHSVTDKQQQKCWKRYGELLRFDLGYALWFMGASVRDFSSKTLRICLWDFWLLEFHPKRFGIKLTLNFEFHAKTPRLEIKLPT